MATQQEIDALKNQISNLTPEQQTGAKTLAQNNISQGMSTIDATNAALLTYTQPIAPITTQKPVENAPVNPAVPVTAQPEAKTDLNTPNSSVGSTQATTPAPTQEKTTVSTPEGTTTTTKETPTVNYNTGEGRQQEILNNLNEGFKNDPNINKSITSGDYNTFKQAYQYDTADATKKQMLDAYFQARQPKDSDGIYQILKTGQKIANPSVSQSRDFVRAQTKYNMFSKLNGMDSNQLLTEMKNNNIGTEMDKELALNPQYQLAKQKYNQYQSTKAINEKNESLSNSISDKKTTYTDPSQKISDSVTSGKSEAEVGTYREYLAKNNPDIVTKVSELNAKNKSLREMADARDAMYKTVIAEHPGISKGSALALAARLNEPLNEQIKSASYELEQLSSDIKYQEGIAREDYAYQQKQQDSEREFEQAKELARFNQTLGLETSQKQFEQQMKQAAQAASDPVLATQQVLDTYAKMGILPTRSSAEIIAEVQRQVAAGKPVGEAITELNKAFQSKPEYKRAMELQAGQMTDREKLQSQQSFDMKMMQAKNIADTKWTKLDDGMYQDSNGNIATKDEITQAKLYNNAYITKEVGETGGDCGFFAARGTGLTATPGGNSKEKRIEAFSDSEPVVGGMAYFTGSGYDQTYGHISIVTGINQENGTITLKESNYNNDGKVTIRTVPISQATGFYNSTPLAGGTGKDEQTTTFKTDAVPQYEEFLKTGKVGGNVATMEAIQKEFGSVENFRKQAEAYNNSETGPRKKELNKIIRLKEQVEGLVSNENSEALSNSVGSVQFTASPWTAREKENYLGEVQNFLDGKTLQQLIDVKGEGATFGALSNEELRMLQNSASKLNQLAIRDDKSDPNKITGFNGSEQNFRAKVKEMIDIYNEKIKQKEEQMNVGGVNNSTNQSGTKYTFTASSGKTYNTNEYK